MDFKAKASSTWYSLETYMENECGHLPDYLSDAERVNLTNILVNFAREAYEAGRSSAKSYCKPELPSSTNNLIGD